MEPCFTPACPDARCWSGVNRAGGFDLHVHVHVRWLATGRYLLRPESMLRELHQCDRQTCTVSSPPGLSQRPAVTATPRLGGAASWGRIAGRRRPGAASMRSRLSTQLGSKSSSLQLR